MLILLTTSYLDEAAACERLVYLDAGRVVAFGTPAALRAAVPLELYRAWAEDPRALGARGARAALRRERARERAQRARRGRSRRVRPARRACSRVCARFRATPCRSPSPPRSTWNRRSSRSRAASRRARRRSARWRTRSSSRAASRKRFGDFTAVDAIDLEVERGVIFAFLGANGSGKSTTIRMLIGLLTPTAGTIALDGIDVIRIRAGCASGSATWARR